MLCAHIQSGMAKVIAATSEGDEQIVDILMPGQMISDPYSTSNRHSVVALTDLELCQFRTSEYQAEIDSQPDMKSMLLHRSLELVSDCRDWMLVLGRTVARDRVAAFLCVLAERMTAANQATRTEAGIEIDLPLTRAEIADILGLTIETVSRQITKLRNDGLIAMGPSRSIVIPDAEALMPEALVA